MNRSPRTLAAVLAAGALSLGAAPALASGAPSHDARPDVVRTAPERPAATLRLACRAASVGGERGVACRWSAAESRAVRGYVLWRAAILPDGVGARERVARVPAGGRTAAFDDRARPGARYLYAVVAYDRAGDVLAIGGPVRSGLPGPATAAR